MLPVFSTPVEEHYYKPELFEDILGRLKEQEVDLDNVSRSDIAGVDEFHVRGAEVSTELVKDFGITECAVLDIGCGIGGPSRMLADDFNCRVTGVDISQEYIRTAQKLSELVGLKNKTKFIQADALNLPFDNGSFDVVWTQHVQMNIEDKAKFYSEIKRVLTDNGIFIYYDIFRLNGEDVNYPVPWANNASVSFLATTAEMHNTLQELGFEKSQTTDQTYKAAQFLTGLSEKIRENGPPKLGLNVLMGNSTKEKLDNILKGLEEKKIALQSGIYIKQNLNKEMKSMEKYLIEVPHGGDKASCMQAIKIFLASGSHLLSNAEWGCKDGEHKAWLSVEIESKEAAMRLVPPALRAEAKIVKLHQFTREDMGLSILDNHTD